MQMKDIPEIARLSTPEKILLVEDSWDSIARGESDVAIPQSHRDELEKRMQAHASTPGNLLSIKELQARIDSRK